MTDIPLTRRMSFFQQKNVRKWIFPLKCVTWVHLSKRKYKLSV